MRGIDDINEFITKNRYVQFGGDKQIIIKKQLKQILISVGMGTGHEMLSLDLVWKLDENFCG
jgi:hypothetical protein